MNLIKDELKQIINNEGDIISFMKGLNNEEKKSLRSYIVHQNKYYNEIIELRDEYEIIGYGSRGTTKQFNILNWAGYYCLTLKEFSKSFHGLSQEIYSTDLSKLYRPNWLGQYINENHGAGINNKNILEFTEKKWLNPTKELIVSILPHAIYSGNFGEEVYDLEDLLLSEITLKEHIWYLFYYETPINLVEEWIGYRVEGTNWTTAFQTLINTGKLDRNRVLQESLLTSNRTFNNKLTSWFSDLITSLKPTSSELIKFQNELFGVCESLNGKSVSVSLKFIKSICVLPGFDVESFLDKVSILMMSNVKSTVTTTLIILEKIMKKDKKTTEKCLLLAVESYVNKDPKIQSRTTKYLLKYGKTTDHSLIDQLNIFKDHILPSNLILLANFMASKTENNLFEKGHEEQKDECTKQKKIIAENKIEECHTFEDSIFFLSQSFNNNAVYHFDLFANLLPRFFHQISNENISQLKPILKQAERKLLTKTDHTGKIEVFMSHYFFEIVIYFINQQTVINKEIQLYITTVAWALKGEKFSSKDKKLFLQFNRDRQIFWTESQEIFSNFKLEETKIVNSYITILNHSLLQIKNNTNLPLLSTPTHGEAWICVSIFINRLLEYQREQEQINEIDFQIAVLRLVLDEVNTPKDLLIKELNGEMADVISYLLFEHSQFDINKCKSNNLWLIAAYKNNDKIALTQIFERNLPSPKTARIINSYEWDDEIPFWISTQWKYQPTNIKTAPLVIQKSVYGFLNETDFDEYNLVFNTALNFPFTPSDFEKAILLSPHNPDFILRGIINCELFETEWLDLEMVEVVIRATKKLSQIWGNFGKLSYLFLACTLYYPKKICRYTAASIWIDGVNNKQMDNLTLGIALGKLLNSNLAPLKRFTDLILSHWMELSKTHDQALEKLVRHFILEIESSKHRGFNKILVIYYELLIKTNSKPKPHIIEKISQWKDSKTLVSTIIKIEKL